MHQLLPLKVKIGVVVFLAFAISWIATAAHLNPPTTGAIVGVVEWLVIFLMLRSWAWLHKLPVPLPKWAAVDLTGVWEGIIQSQYQTPSQTASPSSIQALMEIRQSWQDIILTLETSSMAGESYYACPSFDRMTNKMTIHYFFETMPTVAATRNNPPQRLGSAIAEIQFEDPDNMLITYTNERGRGGDIVLRRQKHKKR